jgi:DNA-binding SARP family transcriptional activator
LALGRHTALVAELEQLVRRHPLRERLRAQLMLALYRCGRQADALATYRAGRRVLRDELGLEPGPRSTCCPPRSDHQSRHAQVDGLGVPAAS